MRRVTLVESGGEVMCAATLWGGGDVRRDTLRELGGGDVRRHTLWVCVYIACLLLLIISVVVVKLGLE